MNQSKTIGLLVSDISREGVKDNFTFEVLCGINDRSGQLGYDLILFNTNSEKQQKKSYTQLCRERKVDGVIIQGIKNQDRYLKDVIDSDYPCVFIDFPVSGERVGYVTTDNVLGAKEATEHLIELGHRTIGMVNGHDYAYVSGERLQGFTQALKEHNISFSQKHVIDGQFSEHIAKKKVQQLLNDNPQITALVCASDLMALGAVKAANQLGLNVPEDLSIVGYDDILLSQYSTPALTTVAQDKYQMGVEAASLLVDMLEDKTTNYNRVLDNELVIRNSTLLKKET